LIVTAHPLQPVTSHRAWVLDADAAVLRPGAISSATIDAALSSFAAALGLREPPPAAIVAVGEPPTDIDPLSRRDLIAVARDRRTIDACSPERN